MKYDTIMVRFGELYTKGKNRKDFIWTLGKNIKNALSNYPNITLDIRYDHIYVNLNGEDENQILDILKDVSGIYALSLVIKTNDDIENLQNVTLDVIKNEEGKTFKVDTKRSNKKYPLHSEEITRIIAPNILRNTSLKVDVHHPDIRLNIEIRDEGAYIFTRSVKGAGGYPLGTSGKVMHMLSGGIDSPVAAYLLMKRGIKLEMIHFAAPPYTNIGVIEKLKDLLSKLNRFQDSIRLTIIPFTKIQEEIYKNCPESYAITIMRRMMYRFSEALARQRNCKAISNGESAGQVASQTLESMQVSNEVTNFPVLRPLVAMDKIDIIQISKKIDTYEISIRPFEDCCTIFDPKNPKTRPDLNKCKQLEETFDYKSMISEALSNSETLIISKDKVDDII